MKTRTVPSGGTRAVKVKSSPNLYSNFLHKMGQNFLDRQYKNRCGEIFRDRTM